MRTKGYSIFGRLLQRLHLRFLDSSQEAQFRAEFGKKTSVIGHLTLLSLAVVLGLFAFLEAWVLGLYQSSMPLMMFALASGMAVAIIPLNYIKEIAQIRIWLVSATVLLGVAAIFTAMVSYVSPQYSYYLVEFVLLLAWWFGLSAIRFLLASLLALSVASVYLLVVMFFSNFGLPALITTTVLIAAVLTLGMMMSYLVEYHSRQLFAGHRAEHHIHDFYANWSDALQSLSSDLSAKHDAKATFQRLLDFMADILDYDAAAIAVIQDRSLKPLIIEGELFKREEPGHLWSRDLITEIGESRQPKVSVCQTELKRTLRRSKMMDEHYRLDLPIFFENKFFGVISLRRAEHGFDFFEQKTASSMIFHAMMAMRTARLYAQTKILASKQRAGRGAEETKNTTSATVIDLPKKKENPLRILPTDQAEKKSEDKYRAAAISGDPLSLIMIDIDGLAVIREKDGKDCADSVFTQIVRFVIKSVREEDVIGRYGRNGMTILSPKTNLKAAEDLAERVRKLVELTSIHTKKGPRSVTLTVGISVLADKHGDYQAMLRRADMAVFSAKKRGGNSVNVRL
ncbi:MAG: diguanylate cyclase [Gammaproteobacteria bacterium]|nr:diguanylate cyclase [Gammaproteobacteria bacterium]